MKQDNVKNGEPYELKGSRTVRERGKNIHIHIHIHIHILRDTLF